MCGRGGPAVLGTLYLAAVRRVLCALPGFAAPGGRCGLAPVLVPWLWPAACLPGVPRGPALVRRSSSGLVALGALVDFPDAVVPLPSPGAVAPGFTGWLYGARGGRPGTGLTLPAAGPCLGKGAGRAPRRTLWGPAMGLSNAGPSSYGLGLRALRWFGLCGPGPSTGDSAGAPGLFCVDANTATFGSEGATPGSRACACACSSWPGRAGRPPGRFLVRLTFLLAVLGGISACSAPSRQGLPRFWLLLGFFFVIHSSKAPYQCSQEGQPNIHLDTHIPRFFFFSPSPPLLRPRYVLLCVFFGPGCLGPWRLVAPPPFFFPLPPPLCAPLSPAFRVFRPRVP